MTYMVVKVLEGAAVVWPMTFDGRYWSLDASITKLSWVIILSIEGIFVQPSRVLSPCHMRRRGIFKCSGPMFMKGGEQKTLDVWQAEHGFSGIPESALKHLCDMHKLTKMDGELTDVSLHTQMAMQLLLFLLPGMNEEQASKCLLARPMAKKLHKEDFLDDFDASMVADVVLVGDQKLSKEFLADRDKIKEKRLKEVDNVKRVVSTCFKPAKESVLKKKAAKPSSTATTAAPAKAGPTAAAPEIVKKKLVKKTTVEQSRVYDALLPEFKDLLLSRKPEPCHVFVDQDNGRFKLSYPGFNCKSVSWTDRGQKECVHLCLATAWKWHHSATAQDPPADLKSQLDL
eukprot:6490365-Amphidinium_carterae.1